jgi:hypothetical protein
MLPLRSISESRYLSGWSRDVCVTRRKHSIVPATQPDNQVTFDGNYLVAVDLHISIQSMDHIELSFGPPQGLAASVECGEYDETSRVSNSSSSYR